jgi:hypothetical protein
MHSDMESRSGIRVYLFTSAFVVVPRLLSLIFLTPYMRNQNSGALFFALHRPRG